MDKYLTYSVVERKDPQNPVVAENTTDVYGDPCGRDGGAYSTGGCGVRLALER